MAEIPADLMNVMLLIEHGLSESMAKRVVDQWTQKCRELAGARKSLELIKGRVVGDRVPNWKDDWETTHSRGLIADACDFGLNCYR